MTRKDTRDHRFKLGSSLEKLKTLNESLKQKPDVILLIQNSPFSSLLDISECKMSQSAILIEKLLDKWVDVEKVFKFGEQGVSIGAIEVTQMLGIKGGETEVDLSKAGESIVWKFLKKTFPKETHRSYLTLLSHLNKEGEQILPDDYFRFYLTLAFTVFLFPSRGDKIECRMLPYLDNVNELNKFNWSGAIQKSLMNALRECHNDQLDKKNKVLFFKGCSFFLQIWALEHTQVSISGVEESGFPLFMKYKNATFTTLDVKNILEAKEVKLFLPDVSPAEGSSSPSAADGGLMDDEFVQTPRGLSTPFADEYGLEGKQKIQASPRIHVSDQDFSKVDSRGSKRLKYSYSLRTTVRGHLQLTDKQQSTENRLVGDVEHLLDSDYRTLSSCSTNTVMNKEEELLKKCKEKNVQHEAVVKESEEAIFQEIKELFQLSDKQQSSENRPVSNVKPLLDSDNQILLTCNTSTVMNKEGNLPMTSIEENVQHEAIVKEPEEVEDIQRIKEPFQLSDKQQSLENRLVGDVEPLLDNDNRTLSTCNTCTVINKEENLPMTSIEMNVQCEALVKESESRGEHQRE